MIVTFFFTLLDNGGFQPIEKFSYFHWLSFDYCTFFLINITKIYIKHLFKDTSHITKKDFLMIYANNTIRYIENATN